MNLEVEKPEERNTLIYATSKISPELVSEVGPELNLESRKTGQK